MESATPVMTAFTARKSPWVLSSGAHDWRCLSHATIGRDSNEKAAIDILAALSALQLANSRRREHYVFSLTAICTEARVQNACDT